MSMDSSDNLKLSENEVIATCDFSLARTGVFDEVYADIGGGSEITFWTDDEFDYPDAIRLSLGTVAVSENIIGQEEGNPERKLFDGTVVRSTEPDDFRLGQEVVGILLPDGTGRLSRILRFLPERDETIPRYNRIHKIDCREFGKEAKLLEECVELFKTLDLPVEVEELTWIEDNFGYTFSDEQVTLLNTDYSVEGIEPFDKAVIRRTEEPRGYTEEDDEYYSNNLGDMTTWITLYREGVATTYSLRIYMDPDCRFRGAAHLSKSTTITNEPSNQVARAAGDLLHLAGDNLEKTTDLNVIDPAEHSALVQLVHNMRIVTATSTI